jgi:hypothetical protein
MPQRWRIEFEEAFWDAVIQLPGWPDSYEEIMKAIADLSRYADRGDLIPETVVRILKVVLPLPDESLLRLVLYYTLLDAPDIAIILYVDDFDNPRHLTDPGFRERLKRGVDH